MSIPKFANLDEDTKYWEIFDEELTHFVFALNKVKDEMYGSGGGNFSNLPGTCTQQVVQITHHLLYETTHKFENEGKD